MKYVILSVAVLLGGCATMGEPTKGPPARCMQPSPAIAPLKPGEDLVEAHGALVVSYKAEASKNQCLRKWTKTVLNRN
jgi:hypothetical protein